ncbi:hypothetical protein B1P87_00005 [Enterococcus faecium]|nr:hypothetical protein B1P87_00005 [Enterococcus faecium]
MIVRDCDKSLVTVPFYDKRCSKASFSVLSPIYAKMWKAIFTKFFLLLETKQLFHSLLYIILFCCGRGFVLF